MKARTLLAVFLVSLLALVGCDQETMMSEKGFRLPDGDAQAGRQSRGLRRRQRRGRDRHHPNRHD